MIQKRVRMAIKVIEKYKNYMNSIITHRFSYSHVNEAFKIVNNYEDNVVKAMIKF